MTDFDTIHNIISEHSLAVGQQTVLNTTPTGLTRAIMDVLAADGENTIHCSSCDGAYCPREDNHGT